jgi:hypothetical protein
MNEYDLRCVFLDIHDFFTLTLGIGSDNAAAAAAAADAAEFAIPDVGMSRSFVSDDASSLILSSSTVSQFICRVIRDINFIHSASISGPLPLFPVVIAAALVSVALTAVIFFVAVINVFGIITHKDSWY